MSVDMSVIKCIIIFSVKF
uniref:Putative glutamate receptor ionotropic kainate 4 n=1 Tax=Triatoma infestans TaxID=30076 RepID=A0A170VEM1_TRIIF